VDAKTLVAIIKSAALICYPTLLEGFGFPILEAFSFGIPVISSNTSSIPEIAKDAAILVNPKDANLIADAILRVLNDNKLASKLNKLGLERVKIFSWEKTANEYLDLYNSIK
jgi:glycosyltransferase involved in cell wall biosynthesis